MFSSPKGSLMMGEMHDEDIFNCSPSPPSIWSLLSCVEQLYSDLQFLASPQWGQCVWLVKVNVQKCE